MSFNVEQIFQSIDVILTQRLNDLSYDKTIIATIVDDSDKEAGHYIVSDGTIKFDAYANDLNYKVDDQVRVTILNGDWSQKKFIAGRYSDKSNNTTPFVYTPPLSTTMLNSDSSLFTKNTWTLKTNANPHVKCIYEKDITAEDKYYSLQTYGIYNTFTLAADFNTSFDAIDGNYGLLLMLYVSPIENSNELIAKFTTLDSSEMLGNPYSYYIDSRQAKQISVVSEGIVRRIELYIYQAADFEIYEKNLAWNPHPFIGRDGNELGTDKTIIFRNIQLGFGSDLTKIEDNSLKIYTTSPATYHYNNGAGDVSNDKVLGLTWYNKSDDNEYIGFSDGVITLTNGTIDQYDEIDYLVEQHADVRLLKYKGQTNIPTDIISLQHAADINESKPYLTKTYQMLTGKNGASADLVYYLQATARALAGTTLETDVSKLISSYTSGNITKDAILVEYANKAELAVQRLINKYNNVLAFGYEVQTQQPSHKLKWDDCQRPKEPASSLVSTTTTAYMTTFNTQIDGAIQKVRDFVNKLDVNTAADQTLAGYRGIYDAYAPKILRAIEAIELERSKIIVTPTSETNLAQYEKWDYTHYEPYAEKDLSAYHNKYCIYWYRYNPKYSLEYVEPITEEEYNNNADLKTQYESYYDYTLNLNREYTFGRFLGPNWERVQVDKDNNPIQNLGLPITKGRSEEVRVNGTLQTIDYFPASPDSTQLLYRRMDPYLEEERYQAVLFYNHTQVNSNVITFINSEADQIPAEFAVDANDKLIIEHGADSQEHYQSYTSNYDLVNIADESKSRSLRVSYDGVFSGDEALADAGIYWYIPANDTSTMLTYDRRHLVDDLGFITDEKEKTPFSKEGYIYFYKQIKYTSTEEDAKDVNGKIIYNADGTTAKNKIITIDESDRYFEYKIKSDYEPTAQNNTIIVEAHIHGENGKEKITTGEIFFTFSTFGTNGTKYTFTIDKATTQVAVLPSKQLDLSIFLKDAEGTLISINEAVRKNPSEEVQPKINTYSLNVCWHAKSNNSTTSWTSAITSPIAIENSEKKKVSILSGAINATTKYVGILGAKVSYNTVGKNANESRVITLNTLYAVPYSSNENYYISGPSVIVYNNQGILSRLSESPFKLYSRYEYDDNGNYVSSNKVVPGQKWSLIYFDNSGNLVTDDDIIRNYMPSLNSDNTIMPAPMYYSYSNNKFYVPVAVCTITDVEGNEDIAWTQPIIITQNQYASPTLNDWNGEFKIDEANGTILSTMLGAGRKTENNTFEGVLMGDVVVGADMDTYHTTARGNASGIGLYGFNDGAQSFYFGVDGTAFLGKATSGRINFDGNNGFIYSQQWLNSFRGDDGTYVDHFITKTREDGSTFKGLKPGKSGLAIDLQSGHIDAYDFKVTSKNIYLNSNPDDTKNSIKDYYFRIGNNGQAAPNSYEDLNSNGDAPQLTKGYMAMSKDGDLEIRANSLSLTGQLGGVNLLRQTSPKRTLPLVTMIKTKTTSNPTEDKSEGEISYSYNLIPMTDVDGNVLYDWDVTKKISHDKYKTYCLSKGYTAITYENQKDFSADNKRTKYYLNNGSYSPTSSYNSSYSYGVQTMEPISRDEWNSLSTCYWNCADNVFLAGTTPNETFDEANIYEDKDFYLAISAKETSVEKKVSQTITSDFKQGEYYTLSGYVSSLKAVEGIRHLNISFNRSIEIPNWSQINEAIEFTKNDWTRFEITFKLKSNAPSLQISFASSTPDTLESVDFALWHLKLESGSIASAWTPAPDDTEDIIRAEQDKFDTYLSQDVIFDRLVTDDNGEKMVGIWMLPGEDSASGHNELYINATYMATGILRSSNWNGIVGKKSTGKTDAYGRNIYTYEITKAPSNGLYLNLDQGKMWAANFELDAGNSSQDGDGLYLNSNPANGKNWFYLGDINNHIKFDKTSSGSSLTLKMQKNFTLTAGTVDSANYLALYSADQSTNTKIGTADQKTWRIIAGKDFGVDKTGKLYATGATISGTITATSGSIGDWILDKGALKSSDGGIILASKAVTIGNQSIAANTILGGTLEGATVSGGTVQGSAIYADTLDIGGYTAGTVGSGAFSVASSGEVTIGSANDKGAYPFKVTSGGALTATSANIGGWNVTGPNSGFSYTTDKFTLTMSPDSGLNFGGGIFSVGINGATTIQDLVVKNSFTLKQTDGKTTVMSADSNGNVTLNGSLKFNGTLKVGSCEATAYPTNGGSQNVIIDTPWSNKTYTATFTNGILTGFTNKVSTSTLATWFAQEMPTVAKLFGINSTTSEGNTATTVTPPSSKGSTTNPIYIDANCTFQATGFNMPATAPATKVTGIPVLKYTSTTKDGPYNLGWEGIQAPTTVGSSGEVWATLYVTTSNSNVAGWHTIPRLLGASSTNAGKYLKASGSGNNYSTTWVDLPTATASDYGIIKVHGVKTSAQTINNANRNYGVYLNNDGKAYVNVPWKDTDTDTTYTAGNGISISDENVISCSVSSGVSGEWMSSSGTARYVNGQAISVDSYVAGVENTGKTSVRKSGIKVSSVTTSSSRSYKNNINTITNSELLLKCRPVSFYFNKDMHYGDNLRYGFIAEEVEEFFPELVTCDLDDNGNRQCVSLNYNDMIALAVAEIQKLRKELDELKSNLNKE